jgi:mono/diheme cytochrome c family protein
MVTAGDYTYETPHLLGTERTGPDLSNVGGKYPDEWHKAHHRFPRKMKPGSIMPSFSFLSDEEMDALVAYLQTLGAGRKLPALVNPPQEIRDDFEDAAKHVNVDASASANAGRGIFMQNCAVCHGVHAMGNGPISLSMAKKPANFTRPFYKNYSDAMWYWRVKEGVPGTRMPRWGQTLGKEQMLYLVAFLKTLPQDSQPAGAEITSFAQVDNPKELDENYKTINEMMKTSGNPYGYSRNLGSR